MTEQIPRPRPKIHPATREVLPDDPLEMRGFEVPGNTDLMLCLLVEEYARMGWNMESIMQLAHDPNYGSFHGLLTLYGEPELRRRIKAILARTGVMRVQEKQTNSHSEQVVEIELPTRD